MTEHRAFIIETLAEIFKIVEEHEPDVIDDIMKKYPEMVAFEKLDELNGNPFGVYCSYLDINRPVSFTD